LNVHHEFLQEVGLDIISDEETDDEQQPRPSGEKRHVKVLQPCYRSQSCRAFVRLLDRIRVAQIKDNWAEPNSKAREEALAKIPESSDSSKYSNRKPRYGRPKKLFSQTYLDKMAGLGIDVGATKKFDDTLKFPPQLSELLLRQLQMSQAELNGLFPDK
jgi:hypothetical protein